MHNNRELGIVRAAMEKTKTKRGPHSPKKVVMPKYKTQQPIELIGRKRGKSP